MADIALSGLKAVPVALARDCYTIGGSQGCDIAVPELGDCGPVASLQVEGGTVVLEVEIADDRVQFAGAPLNAGHPERLFINDSFTIAGRVLTITPALISLTGIKEPGLTWAVLRFLTGLVLLVLLLPIQLMFSREAEIPPQLAAASNGVKEISWDLPFTFPSPVRVYLSSSRQVTSSLDNRAGQLEKLLGTPAFASTFLKTLEDSLQSKLGTLPKAQQLSLLASYALFGGFISCGGSLGLHAESRIDVDNYTPGLEARLGPGGWLGPLGAIVVYFIALYGPVSMFLLMVGTRSKLSIFSAMLRYGLRFVIMSVAFILLFSGAATVALKALLTKLSLLDFLISLKVVTPFSHLGVLGSLAACHLLYITVAIAFMLFLNLSRLKRGLALEHAAIKATGTLLANQGRQIADHQREQRQAALAKQASAAEKVAAPSPASDPPVPDE